MRWWRSAIAVAVVAAAMSAAPPPADAHLRTGTVAVDYRVEVSAFGARSGLKVRVFQSDRAVGLVVRKGHSVLLLGYLGEPLARVGPRAIAVDVASPTAVAAGLVRRSARSGGSRPVWRLERGRNSLVWHDARVQPPPAGVRRTLWTIPIVVDGRRSAIRGEIWRLPRPALWPWLVILVLALAGAAPLVRTRRADVLRVATLAAGGVAGAGAVVTVVGFALDSYASPGTWIAGIDETIAIGVCAGVAGWGPLRARVGGAAGVGVLALAVGLSKGPVFLHPIVLSVLPGILARFAAAASITAGLVAAVVGAAFYTLVPHPARLPASLWQDFAR